VEIDPDELINSKPIWGKFGVDQKISKKEIETFLLKNGEVFLKNDEVFSCSDMNFENDLDDLPKNVKALKYEAYGDLSAGTIYVFETFEIAEKYFEDMFKYESQIVASKGVYARYYSAVQIGNILAIGGDELIFRLVKEYVPDFERKDNIYGKELSIEKYNEEIEMNEITLHMESKGYEIYISSNAGEKYYGFLNLNTNDFCYIVVCESSESAQKCAERFKGIASYTTYGVSFLYGREYMFSSRTDIWKNVLSEMTIPETGVETRDGSLSPN
jgi:hypothetical protein